MSALSPTTLSLGELESTFGALFVGFVVSIILYGFTFFRAYKPVLQTCQKAHTCRRKLHLLQSLLK